MTRRWRTPACMLAFGILLATSIATTGIPFVVPLAFVVTCLVAWDYGVFSALAWIVIIHGVVPAGLALFGQGPFYVFPHARGVILVMMTSTVIAESGLACLTARLRLLTDQLRESKSALGITNAELTTALDEVKELRGLLPICAWCKKVRNVAGDWGRLESYLERHSGVTFTHGLCPQCFEERSKSTC